MARSTVHAGRVRMSLASACRAGRLALGLTQTELAERAGIARSYVAAIERHRANPSIEVVVRVAEALGLEPELVLRPPVVVGDRRQRDVVHAICSGYVDRRLRTASWETAREVEIIDGRWRGWIDLLAFDRRTGTLIVIEIKTVIDDMGAVERQVGWYERVARQVAQRRGWRPRRVVTWLLVLATTENDAALTRNREVVGRVFSLAAPAMETLVFDPGAEWPSGRGLAMIAPAGRRRRWLRRARIHGGRGRSPYRDYADAAASLSVTRRR